jgi:UPF0716 protein FxsA
MPFLVIFIVIPLLEIVFFTQIGDEIGFFNAFLLLILNALIGGVILRYQGMITVMALGNALNRGKVPLSEIFDGFCLVAAALLLIIPGFISDIFGYILLIPGARQFLRVLIRDHTDWYTDKDTPIEGDYQRLDDDNPRIGS